uniref:Uncharacterized protein n=1 Tax=Zea mays TaxID=4577 RepID=C0PCQ9_MAIZE|nr:unknown [Zea mays]ACR35264.1 unknown [Zea mays]
MRLSVYGVQTEVQVQKRLRCYSFRLATKSLLMSSVTTLLLPRSCGGIRAFPAALPMPWDCDCILGNLLRES